MPTISTKRPMSLWERVFGDEKSRFIEGIKRRREGTEDVDPSEYFFDPATSELTAPTVMMTRYLKKGVPDVARRIEGTKDFLKKMKGLGPSAEAASTLFAERYPRVAAHIRPETYALKRGQRAVADVNVRIPNDPRTRVRFSPRSQHMGDIENTLLHEATHVAQDLGNPKTYDMYTAYNRALTPSLGENATYLTNPFEASARTVADRKMGQNLPPFKALEAYKNAVERLPAGSPERLNLALSMKRR